MKKRLLFASILLLTLSPSFAQSDAYRDKSKCFITAQDFVKSKLKYPKEARFDRSVVHETNGVGSSILLGKVMAKNAIGIQTEYVYKIWLSHNGKDWTDSRNWSMTRLILEDSSTNEQTVFDNRTKPQIDKTVRNAGSVDGISCTIYESNSSATRVITSKKMTETQIKKVPSALGIKTNIIYFHLSANKNRGGEYAMKNKDLILIY